MTDKNPYRPGAATPPLFLAGRDPELRRFRRVLQAAPELPANLRLVGLRGVGKSVLLREFESIAVSEGWLAARVQLEPRHNSEDALAGLVISMCDRIKAKASRVQRLRDAAGAVVAGVRSAFTVTIEDITFSMAGDSSPGVSLTESLLDAATVTVESGRAGVAILLDEAQVLFDERARNGEHPLSMLVAAINGLQEQQVPIALVLCGLPTLRSNLQRARTYSERMFRGESIGALHGNPGPARDAFVKPLEKTSVDVSDGLVDRVLSEVEGYPFFIQLWGAELWDAAMDAGSSTLTIHLLEAIEPDIYGRLDEEFYTGRVDTLTPSEQDLLLSTAACSYPPLRSPDVQAVSHKSVGNINVLMGRLVDQGVLFRVQKGQYEYTAPKFHDYLQRRVAGLPRA